MGSDISRRSFLKTTAYTTSAIAFLSTGKLEGGNYLMKNNICNFSNPFRMPKPLDDLKPAKWIWFQSRRTLANTFVLFRKNINIADKVKKATGWVVADSRYLLEVNGQRVQWGPAPCDPRYVEADPVDLTGILKEGDNTIGAKVLFYGHGDGTSPAGKPGFLFYLEIEYSNGQVEKIVSNSSWQSHLARAWRPGQYKRWYLRSLQEEFDARLYPYGFSKPGFEPDGRWQGAMELNCPADKPAVCSNYPEYLHEIKGDPDICMLLRRQVPMLNEYIQPTKQLTESMWINWKKPAEDYFDFGSDNCFTVDKKESAKKIGENCWQINFGHNQDEKAAALTFEFDEQIVGWPMFTIEASAGTTIELMMQESHEPGNKTLLNTHHNSWSRFICKEGINNFEAFDFESCRWLQLHIRNAKGKVIISKPAMRRRIFPWPENAEIKVNEPKLAKLIEATINTLDNSAQENCVDGMGRERQQYSGDCGHQLHPIWFMYGEKRLPARYLRTFSHGITKGGYFLDCWPAFDRLNRIMFREIDMASWGPILDHGVGFNFDCYYHYLYTSDLTALEEIYPRLVKFAGYLKSIQQQDGLLPVDDIGVPCVWIDHSGFEKQSHKMCSFNLYACAMLKYAFGPLAKAFGDKKQQKFAAEFSKQIHKAAVKNFWSDKHKMFIDNLPWLKSEKNIRTHDRTLSTAILYDLCPNNNTKASVKTITDCPDSMGFSYPANAGWRLWALGKAGKSETVLNDLRTRWANMDSVKLNNTISEDWTVRPDSSSQWSHCAVAPLYVLYMSIAGIMPLEPGFGRCQIKPLLADLEQLELTARTVRGDLIFAANGKFSNRYLSVTMPAGCVGRLVVDKREKLQLKKEIGKAEDNMTYYILPAGKTSTFTLKYT
ncbi:MAG: alpha-L-rhamnosidase N-terminal domain-containing protein [Planctomycetes bacterium]|nr:alpha-L-rhamnosidase N-terminal domain-containing protein [Planctomycetota bacterium]